MLWETFLYLRSIFAVPLVYLERLFQLGHVFTVIWVAEVFKGKKDQDVFYYLYLLLQDLPFVENFKDRKLRVFPVRSTTEDVLVLRKCYK